MLLTAANSVVAFAPTAARTTVASAYHFFMYGSSFSTKISLNRVAAYRVKRILVGWRVLFCILSDSKVRSIKTQIASAEIVCFPDLFHPGLLPGSGHREISRAGLSQAKSLGFSLDEIREILRMRERGHCPCGDVVSIAQRHLRTVEEHSRQTALQARLFA